jgi:AhpD family alkylhydroperoxidase
MEQRINVFNKGANAMKALYGIGAYLSKSPIEQSVQHLVKMRASQINGCAYCLDMHAKDMRSEGESEQRIYLLNAWRETAIYTERERAALAWTEAVTELRNNDVPDDVYEMASAQFDEQELIDLTLVVTTINTYNRINIAFRKQAGDYVVGQWN